MKQKKMNIVLVLGVLVIWVFVLRKFFSIWEKEPSDSPSFIEMKAISTIQEIKKDTFILINMDRDPFLEYGERKKNMNIGTDPSPKKEPPIPLKSIKVTNADWPKLQYFGFLRGDSNSERLALIKIENKLHRIREKSTVESIQVIKVYKDSVVLRKDGTTKIITK